MIHGFKMKSGEFKVHSFDFSYMTDHVAGAPAEHGSVGFLDLEIVMDPQQDPGGENFVTARKLLWQASVDAPNKKPDEIREEMSLSAKQSAGPQQGKRDFTFQGWVTSYHESSHGGPQVANRETIRARIVVRSQSKTDGYRPKLI